MIDERLEKEILKRNASISLSLYEVLGVRAGEMAKEAKRLQVSFAQSAKETMAILSGEEGEE